MTTLRDRLISVAGNNGLSVREFEQKAGLNRGNISNMTGAIGSDKLSKIIDAFPEVDLHWLVTGKEESRNGTIRPYPKDGQAQVAAAHLSEEGIPLIPLEAVAGFCAGNSAQILENECEKYVVPSFRGADFMIPVKGSSMYPKYSSGDIVACKCLPLDTFFQWNKVYVADTEQGVVIKRVMPGADDDHIKLVSENERYPPFEIHRTEITSLAIVIGVIRLE